MKNSTSILFIFPRLRKNCQHCVLNADGKLCQMTPVRWSYRKEPWKRESQFWGEKRKNNEIILFQYGCLSKLLQFKATNIYFPVIRTRNVKPRNQQGHAISEGSSSESTLGLFLIFWNYFHFFPNVNLQTQHSNFCPCFQVAVSLSFQGCFLVGSFSL